MSSGRFNHSGQKQSAARQFGDYDVFVQGVGAIANAAHTIECRNPDPGGEVSIRATAHGGLLELPADVAGDGPRFLVERCDSWSSLHRHAVDSTFDAKLATLVERSKRMEFAIEAGRLLRL